MYIYQAKAKQIAASADNVFGSEREKMYLMTPSEDSDQPAQLRSLISLYYLPDETFG